MPDNLSEAIVLHPQTASAIRQFLRQPSHAIVLLGPTGSGKTFAAQHLASHLMSVERNRLELQAHYKLLAAEKDKSSIGIEAVRDLQQFTKLRLPDETARRVIIVEGAHTLTTEAQNALLKLLEEPPANTHFLLTASSGQAMLPTIRSRSQQLIMHTPAEADLIVHFGGINGDEQALRQAASLSGGLPGLMHALLHAEEHPMRPAIETARKLLQSNQFERLSMVDAMSKQKPETLQVLFVLQHMSRKAILKASQTGSPAADKSIRQWHRIMQAAYDAERAYSVSAQSKLTLTNLMLSL